MTSFLIHSVSGLKQRQLLVRLQALRKLSVQFVVQQSTKQLQDFLIQKKSFPLRKQLVQKQVTQRV